MFVLFAVVIVDVGADDQVAQWFEAFGNSLVFGAFGEVSVTDVKIETHAGEAGVVDEGAEISGIAHFAGGVFNAQRDAGMVGMQTEMLEGTESGIAFARIGEYRANHPYGESGESKEDLRRRR